MNTSLNPELSNLLEEAVQLRNVGKLRQALDMLRPVAARLKRSAVGCGVLATLYFELNEPPQAARWYASAVDLVPRSERASLGLFHSLWALGKIDQAFDEMRRFLILGRSPAYTTLLRDLHNELDSDQVEVFRLPLTERAAINAAEHAGIDWRESHRLTPLRELVHA